MTVSKLEVLVRKAPFFLRHDQMLVVNYGSSQNHESFMPEAFHVVEDDLPILDAFGKEVWEGQLKGESKEPFTIAFTSTPDFTEAFGQAAGPLLKDPPTGNVVVDNAVADIRARTRQHWITAPPELRQLMSTGDVKGLEGTDGYIFPPMVIANGVLMTLVTYAHSGVLNILASQVEGGGIKDSDLPMLKRLVKKIADENLAYLQSLSLDTICGCFSVFFDALDQAQTVAEVHSLVRAISLFGALMHGWFIFLFPWRLGIDLRRQPSSVTCFTPESTSNSLDLPSCAQEASELGVGTCDVASLKKQENLNSSTHVPVTFQTVSGSNLPVVFYSPASGSSDKDLAIEARPTAAEKLPEMDSERCE